MSTVAYPKGKVLVVDDSVRMVGSAIGSLMAMACSALPILTEPERLYPPKVYPENVRHQGAKERARRLKRMA
ncbi:MAG: hypothetical protein A2Y38_15565 [Spirochaetes bacterium GWB1_59_5]|nr:MAG: hypothetical protein A2Y38_15565 [Spirochaetes bacterium GWB1_59_5]